MDVSLWRKNTIRRRYLMNGLIFISQLFKSFFTKIEKTYDVITTFIGQNVAKAYLFFREVLNFKDSLKVGFFFANTIFWIMVFQAFFGKQINFEYIYVGIIILNVFYYSKRR
jgi:hypothetical protein